MFHVKHYILLLMVWIVEKFFRLISKNLLSINQTAKKFVVMYGSEDNNEQFIYADTLIIFSKLSLTKTKQAFYGSKDIFQVINFYRVIILFIIADGIKFGYRDIKYGNKNCNE